MIVDAETFNPLELQCLSAVGSLIQTYEYVEVERSVEVPDDLFDLPSDYVRLTPISINEYSELHEQFWEDLRPIPSFRPRFPKFYEAPKYEFAMDSHASQVTAIATNPQQAKILEQHLLRQEAYRTPQNRSGRRAFILVNVVAILFGLGYLALRRLMRRNKIIE